MTPEVSHILAECRQANPNHHLWNNNGTWWFHCTVHRPDYTKERLRWSLETGDLREARARRDERLLQLAQRHDLQLSIRSGRASRGRESAMAQAA
ncbi:MAG: hypothetical protein PWP23_3019 [Candidatus Sumerlaeota bacterium]|nr:hypothetical protein [Candidatus Sumerlaeota bacterium]